MTLQVDPTAADAWAKRVLGYVDDAEHRRILDELAAQPAPAMALLDRLAANRDPIVRAWAGGAGVEVFGRDAIPLLQRLVRDRDGDVRDMAHQELLALDATFASVLLPDYRRVLKRHRDLHGEDKAAMWHVARLRDQESVALLREYAAHHDSTDYAYRMPLVLAEYIEDPWRITRRIRDHDHDWMFWLVDAATLLEVPDAEEAFAAALPLVDGTCAEIIRKRPRRQTRDFVSRDIR